MDMVLRQLISLMTFIAFVKWSYSLTSNKHLLHLYIEENVQTGQNPIGNIGKMIINQTGISKNEKFKSFELAKTQTSNYQNFKYIKIVKDTGDIWLQTSIDREDICQKLHNCDSDKTKLEYFIYVDNNVYELIIEIKDVNDNYPIFKPEKKVLEIPESIAVGTSYSLPLAKDKDSSKFGVKRYILKNKSNSNYKKYFKLKNENDKIPKLVLINTIDREYISRFEFYLYAIDGGDYQGKCDIVIKVTDINDNTPQWIGLPYRKEIPECTSEDMIMKLLAEDKDDPNTDGGKVDYRISENTENYDWITKMFFISNGNVFLNVGALKSYGKPSANIVVIAKDGGGRINETSIEINITDCNDHRPEISLGSKVGKVRENQVEVQKISRVTVEDRDLGQNSQFNCYLNDTFYMDLIKIYSSNDNNGYQIKTYFLQTKPGISFDREKIPRYSVELICKDMGSPSMSSSQMIMIYIEDENDNAPEFTSTFQRFMVSEDAERGSSIGQVTAKDIDYSPNNIVVYTIEGEPNVMDTFQINQNGEIQVKKKLDRETIEQYKFEVRATDSGKPALNDTCQVTVLVTDVNDCSPEIESSFRFRIPESRNQHITHSNLGQLNATDNDNGRNGSIFFRKRTGTWSPYFTVLEDGRISVYGAIDREKTETLEVIIEVVDRGIPPRTSSTNVLVEILDINDNTPIFKLPNNPNWQYGRRGINMPYVVNISTSLSLGSPVTQIEATDPDLGENGTVVFQLMNSDSINSLFTVHDNGQILLNGNLQLKKQERPSRMFKKSYQLVIDARDKGTPPLKSTLIVTVQCWPEITPENDENKNFKSGGGSDSGLLNGNGDGTGRKGGGGTNDGSFGSGNSRNRLGGRGNFGGRDGRTPNKGGSRGGMWRYSLSEGKSLLILLICVVCLVVVVLAVAIFCFVRNHCHPAGAARQGQSSKQIMARHSAGSTAIGPGSSSNSHSNYQKASKINKDKSESSLNNITTYRLEAAGYPVGDSAANYTNLTWLKNDFYSPIDPRYNYQPTNSPLLRNPVASPSYSAFQSYCPSQTFESNHPHHPQQQQQQQQDNASQSSAITKWPPSMDSPTTDLNGDVSQQSRYPTKQTVSNAAVASANTATVAFPVTSNNNPSDSCVNLGGSKTFTPGLERRNPALSDGGNINKSDSTQNIRFNYVTSSFV